MKRRRIGPLVGQLALSVVIAATLAGCAGGVSVHESAELAVITDSGFLTGDEAAIRGTVAVTDEGCIGIADADGNVYPTIWPGGTSLADATVATIDIPGVGSKAEGDAIEGTGGYYSVTSRDALNPVADRCDWDGEIIGVRFDQPGADPSKPSPT